MLITCYYYDEFEQKYLKTSYKEMIRLEESDNIEYKSRYEKLCRRDDGKIPMVMVKKGANRGFRRKPITGGNQGDYSRGERESFTHQGNKEAIASLKELTIKSGDETIKLYIERSECEKSVVCRGKRYEIDIYLKLKRTEPAEYFTKWNGELWFEIFHTCKVDYEQAVNFAIENKTLFEYKVGDFFSFYDNISVEGYEKRKNHIAEVYAKNGINGILICQTHNSSFFTRSWKRNEKGHISARIGGTYFTVMRSKYDDKKYIIIYGDGKVKTSFNGKEFITEEDAMKIAEHLAFLHYNKEKIEKL